MWFHFPALIARSDAIDTPPPAPDRGLLSSCGFVFGVMLVCVSGLVSGGVVLVVVVVRMYEVFWRGLPHQHIVGFHSLELYLLVD